MVSGVGDRKKTTLGRIQSAALEVVVEAEGCSIYEGGRYRGLVPKILWY
jgi:hypothetical protein